MSQALATESGRLIIELHAALQEMDPARWNHTAADSLRAKIRAIQKKLGGLTAESGPEVGHPLRGPLLSMSEALTTLPDEGSTVGSAKIRWMAFRRELVPRYEAVRSALDDFAIHVPSLRPTNHWRTVFHMGMATGTLAILYALPDATLGIYVVLPFFVWAWTMEYLRRRHPTLNGFLMKAFGPFAHPHETRRVNSATWYTTALMVLSLTRSPLVCAVGIAVLGYGDPVAALIGRRFGKHKLIHGRSLEGSAAFLVAGLIGGFAVATLFAPGIAWLSLLGIVSAGACAGTLAELFSLRIDDNLSVAITATAAAAATAMLLGVPV